MTTARERERNEKQGARSTPRLLQLRRGQLVLLLALLSVLAGLISTSWVSVGAHDDELQGLFSEEADGTAMTFAQRESFGVVLEIDDWSRGDATARDVQIARALLGQRLQVVTASGATTFELARGPYHDALARLDEVVRALDDRPVDERLAVRRDADPILDEFESRSRELSAIFQELTRERATESIEARATVEQVQAGLASVIVLMGVALAAWLAADLQSSYRRASLRLRAETRRLTVARRSLELREALQERGKAWGALVTDGAPIARLAASIRADLADLLDDVEIAIVDADSGRPRAEVAARPAPSSAAERARALPQSDVTAALELANESLRLARIRDRRDEIFALERQHDPLTGLPNRELLTPIITECLAAAGPTTVVSLALVDIDRFADFNSSFGHAEGDRLLVDVANRLTEQCSRARGVLRLSADEFAVVGDHPSEHEAREAVEALSRALSFSHVVGSESAPIAVTIGAILAHAEDTGSDALIQRAAAALASAQHAAPRAAVRFFERERDEHLMAVMQEESALRSALRSGEFEMHFQPIIDLTTGALAACEALVRWNRPGVGLLGPGDFLPAVARAGLSVDLGWQVIDQALTAWGALRASASGALDEVRVSVNVEAAQLQVPTFTDYIVNAAQRTGVPERCVVVEVTEGTLLSGVQPVGQLSALRDLGVRVALDDFGTGYSSLAQASSLPLDILKIDRSFIPDAELDPQQRSLLRDIMSFATTLGLAVTAEGVESASVADALRELGVDYGQGWHWGRAMPVSELAAWIESRGPALSPL